MSIQPLRATMTEAEYDAARARLAPDKTAAGVRWEQELALLFARSGWTQDKLAQKEGKTQSHIGKQLRFGRFLAFSSGELKAEKWPSNLTEKRFRTLWAETNQNEGNERIRFQQVLKYIQENMRVGSNKAPKGYRNVLRQNFSDGQWYPLAEIAEAAGVSEADTRTAIREMKRNGNVDFEHRLKGRDQHDEYRLFTKEKTVSATELADKLGPIIKDLKIEGKKNMATMVPGHVAMLAEMLQRLLDEWTV